MNDFSVIQLYTIASESRKSAKITEKNTSIYQFQLIFDQQCISFAKLPTVSGRKYEVETTLTHMDKGFNVLYSANSEAYRSR